MSTIGLVQLLYAALAIVMTGLGLSLRLSDFRDLRRHARGALLAVALQMLVLPLVALSIVLAFGMTGYLAVGMILLAATPGSITSNLYSHLFGGRVAFSIALTGANTFLCALTLPFLGSWALSHFVGDGQALPVLLDKALQTIGIVVIPVLFGMAVAAKAPAFAAHVNKPVKILSGAIVVIFSVAGIVKEWDALAAGFAQVGFAVLLFNVASLLFGFFGARLLRLEKNECVTIGFQASIHNAIQAIYVGIAVLNVPLAALPGAVYSITMNLVALTFGIAVTRKWQRQSAAASMST